MSMQRVNPASATLVDDPDRDPNGEQIQRIKRIDVHAHAFPEHYLRGIAARYPDDVRLARSGGRLFGVWAGTPIPSFDPDDRIADMERDSVAAEVLSAPTVYTWLDDATADWCHELNDFQADLARRHPGRFRSFLHLPVHRPATSIEELERWAGHTEVAGVVFGSNMGGRYPADREFLPVWEAIAQRDLPVFIHPLPPAHPYGPVAPPVVLFPSDTAIAAGSIIYAGLNVVGFTTKKTGSGRALGLHQSGHLGEQRQ